MDEKDLAIVGRKLAQLTDFPGSILTQIRIRLDGDASR